MACAHLTEKERNNLLLSTVVAVLAVVAIIVSGVSLSRPGIPIMTIHQMNGDAINPHPDEERPVGHAGPSSTQPTGARIFSIAIGHDYGAHEYLDDKGYIQGFAKDLIHAVCNISALHCRIMWDKYENCWDSEPGQHSTGGKGLLGKYYDACIGYTQTVSRIHVFDFSTPYLERPDSIFYLKKGKTGFNPMDLTDKKIGFLDGWASDEKCIARQEDITGRILPVSNVFYAKESRQLLEMLNDGSIDAAFTTETTFESELAQGTIDRALGSINQILTFQCSISGSSIMTRKDSTFIPFWDQGFQMLVNTGGYKQLCEHAATKHGAKGSFQCIQSVLTNSSATTPAPSA